MNGRLRGSVIGAVFGLIYVIVNSGPLPAAAGIALRLLGGVGFIAVLIAVARSSGRSDRDGDRMPSEGFGRSYWLVVTAEVAALAAGLALLNGPLNVPQAGVAWVSFVVGVHFVALAGVFRERLFVWLGGGITACGLVGLALVAAGAAHTPVAVMSGVIPGALLLAASWWGARQGRDPETNRRACQLVGPGASS